MVLFIMLYRIVLTFGFVNEILECYNWNESYRATEWYFPLQCLSCCAQNAKQSVFARKITRLVWNHCEGKVSLKQVCATNEKVRDALQSVMYKVVLTIKFMDQILKCDHSNESYCAVLSCRTCSWLCYKGWFYFWVCVWNPQVWPFKWKPVSSTILLRCTRSVVYLLIASGNVSLSGLWEHSRQKIYFRVHVVWYDYHFPIFIRPAHAPI